MSLILPRKRLILAAGLLAAPAIILSPAAAECLEKAGFVQPSVALEKKLSLTWTARTAGLRGKRRAGFAVQYIGGNQAATNGTSWAPSGQSIGDAAADRDILIGVYARDSVGGRVDDVRVGVASNMSKIAEQNTTFGHLQFWLTTAYFPTTTSQTLNFGASGTINAWAYDLWRITGLTTRAAFAEAKNTANNTALTLSVPAGGAVIGISLVTNDSTCTVTGATEKNDRTAEPGTLNACCAQGTAGSLTFNWASASNPKSLAISLL